MCQFNIEAEVARVNVPARAETAPDQAGQRSRAGVRAIRYRASGEIDRCTHREWEYALQQAIREDAELHFDLSQLGFIDTRGTSLLVVASRQLPRGRRLVLHNAPPTLIRVLELLWPDGVPTIVIGEPSS